MRILNLVANTLDEVLDYDLPVQFNFNQIYEIVQMYVRDPHDSTWTRLRIAVEFNENDFILHRVKASIFGNFYTPKFNDNHGLNLSEDINLVFNFSRNKAGVYNSVILCIASDEEVLSISRFSLRDASDCIKLPYD